MKINSFRSSAKSFILFPGSEDLILSVAKKPRVFGQIYKSLIPKDYSLLVLGYDPNMTANKTPLHVAMDMAPTVKELSGPGVVMGISYGGFVAMSFAAKYPQLTNALIVGSSAHTISPGGRETGMRWMELMRVGKSKDMFAEFPKLFGNKMVATLLKMSVKLIWSFIKKDLNPSTMLINAYEGAMEIEKNIEDLLEKIRVPTLIIVGSKDQLFSVDDCTRTRNLIKDSKLEVIEGGTHTVLYEKPKLGRKIIASFLSGLKAQ